MVVPPSHYKQLDKPTKHLLFRGLLESEHVPIYKKKIIKLKFQLNIFFNKQYIYWRIRIQRSIV